jgi:hypothetical protein
VNEDYRARNGNGKFTTDRYHAERDRRIATLAADKVPLAEIARIEGISPLTVRRAKERALTAIRREGGEVLADAMLSAMQTVEDELWKIAITPGYKCGASGKPDRVDENGQPMPDLNLAKDALLAIEKLISAKRALLGVDAPKRSVRATYDIDDKLREVAAQIQAAVQHNPAIAGEVVHDSEDTGGGNDERD